MTPSTLFIVNPAAGAGRGGQRWRHVEQELRFRLVSSEVRILRQAGEARVLAGQVADKYDRLIAVGGDGTISEVAEGILAAPANQCVLGMIPVGTGNDIAQTLGIHNLSDALLALAQDSSNLIDVIEINCLAKGKPLKRQALLFAGVGILGAVLRSTTPLTKRLLGHKWAYRAGLLRALRHYRPPQMRIVCDGQASEGVRLFLGVSKGEHAGGGMRIAPGARLDDGVLNVNLVGDVGPWEVLKQMRRLRLGRHTTHPLVRYFTARHVTVESNPAEEVAADGELIGHTPASFTVRPGALRVLSAVRTT